MNTILVSKFYTTINERILVPAGNVLSNRLIEYLERLWTLSSIIQTLVIQGKCYSPSWGFRQKGLYYFEGIKFKRISGFPHESISLSLTH